MAPSEEKIMLSLGYAIYEAQETEATLHLAMSLIFGLSVAKSIDHLKKIYEKKTLGQFLHIVREKIGLSKSFDGFMVDYIEQRNFITHNISRTSVFSPYTDEGRQKLMNFLTSFRYTNRKAKLTFMALTEVWMKLTCPEHMEDEKFKELRKSALFQEIQREYIPQLKVIFGSK